MISRRHIRLKVMQSLYAYFIADKNDFQQAKDQLFKEFDSIINLYLLIISLPCHIAEYSIGFMEEQKNNHLASDNDKKLSQNFQNNKLIKVILDDKSFMKKVNKVSILWKLNDHEIIRKLFLDIWKSDIYKDYSNIITPTFENDQLFLLNIFEKYIIDHDLLHHILEEESIYWMDDLPFVSNIIYSQIKSLDEQKNIKFYSSVFKNSDDSDFARNLLLETIFNHKEYELIIKNKAKNWDLERIASMDHIILLMAFCELLNFKEIPIKVTLNEYIEVAKYYSTSNSKGFINGILDKVIIDLKKKGKIKKTGRGLIE